MLFAWKEKDPRKTVFAWCKFINLGFLEGYKTCNLYVDGYVKICCTRVKWKCLFLQDIDLPVVAEIKTFHTLFSCGACVEVEQLLRMALVNFSD